jgi:toxin ParE1/3/4
MSQVVYTQRARRDLLQIAVDDPGAARVFEWRLRRHCSLLATTPEMGRQRPEIGRHVRSLVQGNYLIFYRWLPQVDRIDILRIWHGRRRLPRLEP